MSTQNEDSFPANHWVLVAWISILAFVILKCQIILFEVKLFNYLFIKALLPVSWKLCLSCKLWMKHVICNISAVKVSEINFVVLCFPECFQQWINPERVKVLL